MVSTGTPTNTLTSDEKKTDEKSADRNSTINLDHTKISGRFNQYTSGFWSLALPMLSGRYFSRFFSSIGNAHNYKNEEHPYRQHFVTRGYGYVVGLVMFGVTSFYAGRTFGDMKRVFAEPLGWEFDKDPSQVGIRDFLNSKNEIVRSTVSKFINYNLRRFAANATFFNFLLPAVSKRIDDDEYKKFDIYSSVDLGVGSMGGYLALDAITRKETFFERLQSFTDRKINQTEREGELITAGDLITLYALDARDRNPRYSLPKQVGSPEWQNDQVLFGRMADLMNQTYGKVAHSEVANFTLPKFIYLLGHGLLKHDSLERNLACVELANQYGIPAVKQVADKIKKQAPLEQALASYPAILSASQSITQVANANLASAPNGGDDRIEVTPVKSLSSASTSHTSGIAKTDISKQAAVPVLTFEEKARLAKENGVSAFMSPS